MSETLRESPGHSSDPALRDDAAQPTRSMPQWTEHGPGSEILDLLSGEKTPARMLALLLADQQQRWRDGQRVPVERYLECHTQLGHSADAIELIYGEWLLRREGGETPATEEYVQRFPTFAKQFLERLEADQEATTADWLQVEKLANQTEVRIEDQSATSALNGEPKSVAGYEIMRELGRGGMGVVYQAFDPRLKRQVALKMILAADFADKATLARFRAEAEAVGRLQHPNIVQIHDVGDHDGRPFLALEFVQGCSLSIRLQGNLLPPRHAASLAEVLARAMHYVHERGIVHRDLKPGNILLEFVEPEAARGSSFPGMSSQGSWPAAIPKITDFGLAKILDVADSRHTRTGDIVGTPSYLAPEQAATKRTPVTPACDVYSLGAILYETVTGRPPFQGATPMDTVMQVLSGDPVPPVRLQPKLPRDVQTICLKCLQKDPAKRYPTAAALAEDLRRFLDGNPIQARPTPPIERAVKWAKRRPAVAALSTAIVVVTVLSFVLLLGLWRRASTNATEAELAKNEAVTAEQREKTQRHHTEEALRQAEKNLYIHLIASAEREWLTHDAVRARQMLNECPPDLRRWEWHYLWRRFRGSLLTLEELGQPASDVAVHPDGRRVFAVGHGGAVQVWDIETGRRLGALQLLGHDGLIHHAAMSPDGTRLATAGLDKTVRIWELADGRLLATLTGHQFSVWCVAFSHDGKLVASGSRDLTPDRNDWGAGEVKVWNAATGQVIHTLLGHKRSVFSVAFSPDDRRLASGGYAFEERNGEVHHKSGEVMIWSLADGKRLFEFHDHSDSVFKVAFSPDGSKLATASADRSIKLFDAAAGNDLATLRGHLEFVMDVAFSPDGKRLVSTGWDRFIKVWEVEGAHREVVTLKGHLERINCVVFTPDGNRLVSAADDRTVKIWDAAGHRDALILHGHQEGVTGLAFHPDNRRLASVAYEKVARLWDAAAGRQLHELSGHRNDLYGVAFSGDGKLLATGGAHEKIIVWNPDSGGEVLTLPLPREEHVWSLAFHPDNLRLAAGAKAGIRIWDLAKKEEALFLPCARGPVNSVAFSSNGLLLACGSGNRDQNELPGDLRIWDMATGQTRVALKGHAGSVLSVAFSRDGQLLAAASRDRMVRVWSVSDGRELLVIKGLKDIINAVAFTPDGERLATAGRDGVVTIWDTATGQEILALKGHTGNVHAIAFSRDGHRLASGGNDRTIRIWDATPARSDKLTEEDRKQSQRN